MAVPPASAHRSIDLNIKELQGIFRRAAPKNWAVPDEKILDDCPYLTSLAWIPSMIARLEPRWVPVEREVRKALKTLQAELPALADMYQALSPIRRFGRARLAALSRLQEVLPFALAAVEIDRRRGTADWHGAAGLIAAQATEAWQKAGRTTIGISATSPLVAVVHDILARAGVEKDHATIAKALGSDRSNSKTQNKNSIRGGSSGGK